MVKGIATTQVYAKISFLEKVILLIIYYKTMIVKLRLFYIFLYSSIINKKDLLKNTNMGLKDKSLSFKPNAM